MTKKETLERIRHWTAQGCGMDWQVLHSEQQAHLEELKREGLVYEQGPRVYARKNGQEIERSVPLSEYAKQTEVLRLWVERCVAAERRVRELEGKLYSRPARG